ncbi:Acyl- N-acyltransferase [Pyrenophora seminiperda CCB06]|uniref:Acyl-N-acyltransferase n=1 Tax=Pyrenophora seminiperda CCB06 TaxID=1302712 RepID=A0A3M7MI41_9PLEO|nr:Acyl- N-acyltransferase [Pyrenophora seminiperda CCB06]
MPSLPAVPGVRLATPDDLYRISIVAAAAFFSSPTFQFQRPFHQDFPADTIASYYVQYEAAIKDPLCAVLVTEDTLKVDEAKHVYEALRGAFSCQPSSQQGIVGICSFQLKPGSSYIDQLQPRPIVASPAANRHDVHDLRRDQSAEAIAIYNEVTHPVKLKYAGLTRFSRGIMTVHLRHLDGNMRLSTLAVAPPYWRRGHARRLVSFCTRLADLDNAIIVGTTGVGEQRCSANKV